MCESLIACRRSGWAVGSVIPKSASRENCESVKMTVCLGGEWATHHKDCMGAVSSAVLLEWYGAPMLSGVPSTATWPDKYSVE